MKNYGLHDIRREYLKFFEEKGHLVHDSYSLVPLNDPSLLLIGAGMAPLKKYFTGELVPPKSRMTTCQKCMRTGDLENVGITARHATFFEMLGNFSFGDYFKHEAINWAWEFLTERLELDKEDLWVSVYLEDDEAYNIWKDEVGVPEERIVRLGKEDNFWELEVGPSGPCSEIHVDRGEKYGCGDPDCKPGCDCDRFLEIWNLVFTQFDKDENGVYHPLAHPNIDTGMGLERITTVLEDKDNIFEIEAIDEIIRKIEEVSGYKYKTDNKNDISVRVITDHVRAMTFMISDMVLPSNEGRGYVLRRLIRRAERHGRLLGITKPFLTEVAKIVIDSWSVSYTELKENEEKILSVIETEENKFLETLDKGMDILNQYIADLEASEKSQLSGKDAFKLYDTYGFPYDLTEEILIEKNITIDEEGFINEMNEQRERARSAVNKKDAGWSSHDKDIKIEGEATIFNGYTEVASSSEIIEILNSEGEVSDSLKSDQSGVIVLKNTPFYAEGGGQIGDTGIIEGEKFKFNVTDTRKTSDGVFMHIGSIIEGEAKKSDKVEAKIDVNRRRAIKRNHSATHLLHKALKEILGSHVNQAGSYVSEDSFRFDFSHFERVSKEELEKIENLVNEYIYSETISNIYETSIEKAYENGAIGLFEDKYKADVRVVEFPEISIELCGGTHVEKTSDIGIFKILSESAVASGVRRIEATTGMNVYNLLNNLIKEEAEILDALGSNSENAVNRINSILKENKELEKEIEAIKRESAKENLDEVLGEAKDLDGIKILAKKYEGQDVNTLRDLADEFRDKLGDSVITLATVNDGKINFVVASSDKAIERGLKAGDIIKQVAAITGGGGGGRPNMATAGGKDVEKLDEALNKVYDITNNLLK